jgi:hypothetical protein
MGVFAARGEPFRGRCIRNKGCWEFGGSKRVNFLETIDKATTPPALSYKHPMQAYIYYSARVKRLTRENS